VQAPGFSVRLACVKHAASVHPEPGSNSPQKNTDTNQPNGKTSGQPAIQSIASTPTHHHGGDDMQATTPNTNPPKKQASKKIWYQQTWHTIEFSNNGHFRSRTTFQEVLRSEALNQLTSSESVSQIDVQVVFASTDSPAASDWAQQNHGKFSW
jgi:hypothetical protein